MFIVDSASLVVLRHFMPIFGLLCSYWYDAYSHQSRARFPVPLGLFHGRATATATATAAEYICRKGQHHGLLLNTMVRVLHAHNPHQWAVRILRSVESSD